MRKRTGPMRAWPLLAALTLAVGTLASPMAAQAQGTGQQVAIPSYIYPSYNPATHTFSGDWARMIAAAGGNGPVGLDIINPNSGPGTAKDPNYAAAVLACQKAGMTVLGYVHTGYGTRSSTAVRMEINNYLSWYPTLDGIFFDEAASSKPQIPYYAALVTYVKSRRSNRLAVLNPGVTPDEGYLTTAKADILVTFESDYNTYVSSYSTQPWVSKYPAGRFWHLVYAAPSDAAMQSAVLLSQGRNAGWAYVTPLGLPNPWAALPADPFWTDELNAVSGP